MITRDIHQLFDVNYDKANVISAYPSFLPEEKDVWLNSAYRMWVNQRITGTNARNVAFEGDAKRISDLQRLVKTINITTYSEDIFLTNAIHFNLDYIADFYIFVSADVKINNTSPRNVIHIDHEQAQKFKETATNVPWIPSPVCVEQDDHIVIYYDTMKFPELTAASLNLTYIKTPAIFDYYGSPAAEFELSDDAAYEIVTTAVLLALENIESERMQTTGEISTIKE